MRNRRLPAYNTPEGMDICRHCMISALISPLRAYRCHLRVYARGGKACRPSHFKTQAPSHMRRFHERYRGHRLSALFGEHHIVVPQELSIVGFDNIQESAFIVPSLTTVDQPAGEKGRQAAEMIFEAINGHPLERNHMNIPYRIVLRDTLAPARNLSLRPPMPWRLRQEGSLDENKIRAPLRNPHAYKLASSPFGIGDLGKEAYEFADFLAKGKIDRWQILPLGPTGYGNSPYAARSTFAGNELFIDLRQLVRQGYLHEDEITPLPDVSGNQVDFGKTEVWKLPLLKKAAIAFLSNPSADDAGIMPIFLKRNDTGWTTTRSS